MEIEATDAVPHLHQQVWVSWPMLPTTAERAPIAPARTGFGELAGWRPDGRYDHPLPVIVISAGEGPEEPENCRYFTTRIEAIRAASQAYRRAQKITAVQP